MPSTPWHGRRRVLVLLNAFYIVYYGNGLRYNLAKMPSVGQRISPLPNFDVASRAPIISTSLL